MESPIKILLVDDHTIIRQGLCSMIQGRPDMKVIGQAGDGRSAVKLAVEVKPDLVLMDISMKDLNGIESTQQIIAADSGIKVLALSEHSDSRFVRGILQAGASGYLLKDSVFDELVKAIHVVMDNGIYLDPEIAKTVVKGYLTNTTTANDDTGYCSVLRPREREVLQLFADGYTSREIGTILCISRKTVEAHRKNIMDKLDIHSMAELTKYAVREGLTHL